MSDNNVENIGNSNENEPENMKKDVNIESNENSVKSDDNKEELTKDNGEKKDDKENVKEKDEKENKDEKTDNEGEKEGEKKEMTEEEKKKAIFEEKVKRRLELLDFMDKSNFKKYYTMLDEGFSSDVEYVVKESVKRVVEELTIFSEGKLIKNEERTQYLSDEIGSFISSIIRRKDLHVESKAMMNPVLQYSLKAISMNIHKETKEIITAFGRVFEKRFYHVEDSSFITFKKIKVAYDSSTGDKYASAKKTQLAPMWAANINFFGESGGFDNILKLLSKEEPERIQLNVMKNILQTMEKITDSFKKEFATEYIKELKVVVFKQLTYYIENMMIGDKMNYKLIIDYMKKILLPVMTEEEISNEFLSLQLGGNLNNLKSTNVQKRIEALRYIVATVERTKKETKKLTSTLTSWLMMNNPREEEEEKEVPVDPKFLTNWIIENKVLDLLFDINGLHPEILKQGVHIAIFMKQSNNFSSKYINILWEASIGKHESDRHALYTFIMDLSKLFVIEDVENVYSLINKLEIHQMDGEDLSFLQSFSIFSITKFYNPKNVYGIKNYWELIQDNPKISVVVFEKALNNFKELLKLGQLTNELPKVANWCIENLAKKQSVQQSLLLLIDIFEITEPKKKRSKLIETLAEKDKLIPRFLEVAADYKKSVNKESVLEENEKSNKFGNKKFGYRDTISIFFNFLQEIIQNSSVQLSNEEIDTIWGLFITNSYTEEESSCCFIWLAVSTEEGVLLFKDNIIEHVFDVKMPLVDVKTMPLKALDLFRKYFIHINAKSGSLKTIKEGNSEFFEVTSVLKGINNLWKFSLEASGDVSNSSIQFLNQLHLNIIEDKKKPSGVRALLISKCVEIMGGKDSSLSERSLFILRNFIEQYETETEKRENSSKSTEKELMSLKIQMDSVNSITLDEISPNETVGNLKRKVSQQLKGNSLTPINLFWEDKELKENNKPLSYYRIDQSTPIFVQKKQPSIVNIVEEIENSSFVYETLQLAFRALGLRPNLTNANKPPEIPTTPEVNQKRTVKKVTTEEEDQSPESILSNEDNFSKMYNLLLTSSESGNTSVALQVWLLLDILPLNKNYLKKFTDLSSVTWNKLIDTESSILKQLYPLKVLSEIFSSYKLVSHKDRWISSFVETGGLSHILSIFGKLKEPPSKNKGDEDNSQLSYFQCVLFLQTCFQNILSNENSSLLKDFAKHSPKDIIHQIITIIWRVSESNQSEIMEISANVIESGIYVIRDLISTDINLLEHFYKYDNLKEWIMQALLKSNSSNGTHCLATSLTTFCSKISLLLQKEKKTSFVSPYNFFLEMILSFLGSANEYRKTCSDYFMFVANLIKGVKKVKEGNTFEWLKLYTDIIDEVLKHPCTEIDSNRGSEDKVLIGKMNILRAIIGTEPKLVKDEKLEDINKKILLHIYNNCLFKVSQEISEQGLDGNKPPHCKTRQARNSAFKLLKELSKHNEKLFDICMEKIYSSCREILQDKDNYPVNFMMSNNNWQRDPKSKEKSTTGYVGLRNQGATCYMNSFMQQMFTIPQFCKGILSVPASEKYITHEEKKESYFYQLQKMFSYLRFSEQMFFDTNAFCYSFKDFEGKPVETGRQQDAKEFCDNLMSKLETTFKDDFENCQLLNQVFGGSLSNQLIGKEESCCHVQTRSETFYTISLEIKNQGDVHKSLELFVQGEILDDDNKYSCSPCNAKRKTLKRSVFHKLPNILVLHLKRFQWVFGEELRTEKVNDYYEFPEELNLYPYTSENLNPKNLTQSQMGNMGGGDDQDTAFPPNYYGYVLSGVVIHQGVADGGHYYSVIKDRSHKGKPSEVPWYEFNDSKVCPFDYSNLKKIAYGGTYEAVVVDREGNRRKEKRPKSTNAYVLIYERPTFLDPDTGLPLLTSKVSVPVRKDIHRENVEKSETLNKKPKKTQLERLRGMAGSPKDLVMNEVIKESGSSFDSPPPSEKDTAKQDEGENDRKGDENKEDINEKDELNKTKDDENDDEEEVDQKKKEEENEEDKKPGEIVMKETTIDWNDTTYPVPPEILSDLLEDNSSFLKERNIFNDQFFAFIWDFINLHNKTKDNLSEGEKDPTLETVKFSIFFFCEILGRAKNTYLGNTWKQHITRLFKKNVECCKWLIYHFVYTKQVFSRLFINFNKLSITEDFCDIVFEVMRTLSVVESQNYPKPPLSLNQILRDKIEEREKNKNREKDPKEEEEKDKKIEEEERKLPYNICFVNRLFNMLPNLHIRQIDANNIFRLIHNFSMVGKEERNYLMELYTVEHLVDFYLCRELYAKKSATTSSTSVFLSKLSHLVGVLSVLIRSSVVIQAREKSSDNKDKSNTPTPRQKKLPKNKQKEVSLEKNPYQLQDKDLFTIDDLTAKTIFSENFIVEMIKEEMGIPYIVEIIKYVCWENEVNSSFFFNALTNNLRSTMLGNLDGVLRCCRAFMKIDDSLLNDRVSETCSYFMKYMRALRDKKTNIYKIKRLANFLFDSGKTNLKVKLWFDKNRSEIEELAQDENESGYSGGNQGGARNLFGMIGKKMFF